MAAVACALFCVGVAGVRAARANPAPCQFDLRQGEVVFASQLAAEDPLSAETVDCLAEVARELGRRPAIRSVTVAARLPADRRVEGAGLAIANRAADLLVAGGVAKWRVSAVAPASTAGEPASLYIAYRERHPARPVARVQAASGQVDVGASAAEMERATHGSLLYPKQLLRTGPRSHARLLLADGSYLRVGPESALRIAQIELTRDLQRRVRIELFRGTVETIVGAGGLRTVFNVLTRTAVAGVRGTDFRTTTDRSDTTRIETLEGEVWLEGKLDGLAVGAGRGSRVGSDGFPEPTRALLAAPEVEAPKTGRAVPSDRLRWSPVPAAARYLVELARDAEFSRFVQIRAVGSPSAVIGANLDPGKWFWRVAAVDVDGFQGLSSKVYSFGLDRDR